MKGTSSLMRKPKIRKGFYVIISNGGEQK